VKKRRGNNGTRINQVTVKAHPFSFFFKLKNPLIPAGAALASLHIYFFSLLDFLSTRQSLLQER
jgi:hypothetical protein